MHTISPYLQTLAEQAHPEGGWSYVPGHAAQLEPTCLALLALSLEAERHAAVIGKGMQFLDRCAAADGSYRLAKGRQEAIWPTAQALFVRAVLEPTANLAGSAEFLLKVRGKMPQNCENAELHDIDLTLTGWPWAENNFSWTEPTVWACLALRRLGMGGHPRVREGVQMLLDRAMDEGGINYGNRRILGRLTEPIPGPSALMLLAVQGEEHPRIAASVGYLTKQLDSNDVEHLCWAKIALDLYRDAPGALDALKRLDDLIEAAHRDRLQAAWLKPAPLRQALTALALGVSERNFFRLPAAGINEHTANGHAANGHAANGHQDPAPRRSPPLGTRIGAWFRGLAVKAVGQLRQLPLESSVHIARANSYDDDLAGILQQQYEHYRAQVPLQGKRVVLKPNLVEYHRDKVINTNPRVVSAVIELCKREGAAEIIVAEGPGHWRNVEYLVSASGLADVLEQHGVPFVDINHDEPVKTPNLGRLTGLEYLYLSRTIATADVLISLPKLKTHHWAGATLSLKNLFGTLPGICYGWPKNELHWRGIDNSIIDIALTRTPELAIVDGIIGMEGDGPLNGTAKYVGALVMGHDLVAVDATCCRLMELDPERIPYLLLGQAKKLGRLKEGEIRQLGESVASLAQAFETVPHLQNLCAKAV